MLLVTRSRQYLIRLYGSAVPLIFALGLAVVMVGWAAPVQAQWRITTADQYVEVPRLQVSIVMRSVVRGMLVITVGLDVPDARLRDTVESMMPVLQDRYLGSLKTFAATRLRMYHPIDIDALVSRLQRVTNETLRKDGATVLVNRAVVRSLM